MQLLVLFASLFGLATAQFDFFDQMFGGHNAHEHHQQQHQPRNNPSDAGQYKSQYDQSYCDKYLCPDTLACVDVPTHCPCAWDANEDKFELGEGKRVCISKGGFKPGEAARKMELARKGLL